MKKKTLLSEVRQLQKIAGLLKEDEGKNIFTADGPAIEYSETKPHTIKKITFPNELSFEVGVEDVEGNTVTSIEHYGDKYEITSRGEDEEFTAILNSDGDFE